MQLPVSATPRADVLRDFAGRRRVALTAAGSLATAVVLAWLLAGRGRDFAAAISDVAVWTLAVAALAQIAALLARSEAWHLSIEAAGGTVARRVLYRASSMQVLGSVLNAQLGVAARISALRRSSGTISPQVPTLIAAEFPILAVEAMLGALASFTLIGPLKLPWWLPAVVVAVLATVSAGLRRLALNKGCELWKGLAVLRSAPRPALAAVLILGSDGVAAAAAAGVLLTVTGTVGGLCFAGWAGADRLWAARRAIPPRDREMDTQRAS